MQQREVWPLRWTTTPHAGKSLITIFDLAELRGTVDTLRISAGLPAVVWAGAADSDSSFVAGKTPVRAAHFNELRDAIDDLYRAADLGSLPPFSAGPIVPGTRVIKLSDTLDLRGWVEAYESLRPDLAARVVRLFGVYSNAALSSEPQDEGRLTEMWDASGLTRYFYAADGRMLREQRVIDNHVYWTHFEHDRDGIVYPDGRAVSWQVSPLTKLPLVNSSSGQWTAVPGRELATGEQVVAKELARGGEAPVQRDARGLAVLVGDPARPRLRLAYDGDGRLAKRVDEQSTTHFVGDHYERTLHFGPPVSEKVTRFLVDGQSGRWLLEKRQDELTSVEAIPDDLWQRLRPLLKSDRRPVVGEVDDRDVLESLLRGGAQRRRLGQATGGAAAGTGSRASARLAKQRSARALVAGHIWLARNTSERRLGALADRALRRAGQ